MALGKTLAHRLLSASPLRAAAVRARRLEPPPPLRRFLQRRPLFQAAFPPDRIRATVADRIRLDGILPPAPPEEVRKALRAAQLEAARARLRDAEKSCVAYEEFVQMCCDASSEKQGPGIAKSLDEGGAVIVLGDHVLLRPDQVAKAIRTMIPLPTTISPRSDERRSELREMEQKKAVIDMKANSLVRKELWGGLGFLSLLTVGFMRLTFWELSWDVMEPICFFATSTYFMAGYAFFMRTAKDPSFEGFFEARFATKQKYLMKEQNFDPLRFDGLRRACFPHSLEKLPSAHY